MAALPAPQVVVGNDRARLSSDVWGAQLSRSTSACFPAARNAAPKIEMAITKQKKAATVEKAKQQLENCSLIASFNYKKFTVKQISDLRKSLPPSCKLIVMKNRLLVKAIEDTPFSALQPSMKGMNAFLFVHGEEIPPALKPFRDMQKELKLEDNDFTGAVFEGKLYKAEEIKQLENLPSRAEVYSKLIGVMIQSTGGPKLVGQLQVPAQNLVSTLQAPARDLLLTLNAHCKKLEEGGGNE